MEGDKEEDKVVKDPKPKKARERDVRIFERRGQSLIVEWVDEDQMPQRRIVDIGDMISERQKKGVVTDEVLQESPKFGVEWAEVVKCDVTPEKFQRMLRTYGIWTPRDFRQNHRGFGAALSSIHAEDIAAIASQREVE